jgi:hypothetical protein
MLGRAEIALDFLEYYSGKSTEFITLEFKERTGKLIIQLNFKSAL